ncbi:extracellular catalytic domain type 1 short-chain-length polyhydroxyalkanoate depolymerase [Methyloferula stellata]|uniref:extracellular catalytic domain type 1 short-chain-length polyhydroxyalkanoate depolymerase n=1 Tax=Methyloferula stellata TaxID=876270 RepID=UPI00036C6636|nr:PHB depolymerase family esterase [Methyloferula stellata]
MTIRSKFDMMEATRLTREGKLQEAMAAIRKMLTGSGPSSASSHRKAEPETDGDAEPFIDMLPPSRETGSSWTAPPSDERSFTVPGSPIAAQRFNGFADGLGEHDFPDWLGGLIDRGTQTTPSHPREGATFEEHRFTNAAGTRTYKLYIPESYDGSPLPLIVMLHGCTQSPDDFAAGTRMNEIAEEQNFIVAYPAQSHAANSSKCWNWFNGSDQRRGQGEASLIAEITRQIMSVLSIDATRVYVAGMSAGGAAAAIMGKTYPDLYAAIGIHSGLPCGAASDITSAFAAMKHGNNRLKTTPGSEGDIVPTIVFHGDADRTVNSVNADDIILQSKRGRKFKTTVNRGHSAKGVKYTRILQTDTEGQPMLEQWRLHGAGHAWSGGSSMGSFTNPAGPDASREMIRFFLSTANRR